MKKRLIILSLFICLMSQAFCEQIDEETMLEAEQLLEKNEEKIEEPKSGDISFLVHNSNIFSNKMFKDSLTGEALSNRELVLRLNEFDDLKTYTKKGQIYLGIGYALIVPMSICSAGVFYAKNDDELKKYGIGLAASYLALAIFGKLHEVNINKAVDEYNLKKSRSRQGL